MSQDFNTLATSNKIKEDVARHNQNYESLRSGFSGASAPTTPTPINGQKWYDSTNHIEYTYIDGAWKTADETSDTTAEVENSRGTKDTLDQRLDVSLNEDGTLKSGASPAANEWITPSLTFSYLTTTTFKVDGNQTDIYLDTRRLKVNLDASMTFSEVVSSAHDGGQDETTITILDAVLDGTLVSVEHSIISPFLGASGGSLSAVLLSHNQTIAGVKTFASFSVTPSSAPTTDYQTANKKYVDDTFVGTLTTDSTAQTKIGDLTIGETVTVSSWSYSGTTITVNTSAIHNCIVGQYFSVSGLVSDTNAPNGRWQIVSVVDTETITFTAVDTPTGTATVSSAELSHGDITLKGAFKEFDLGQTWQDMTASRATDVTYTNNTGKPIFIAAKISSSSTARRLYVDSIEAAYYNDDSVAVTAASIVPNKSTYKINGGTVNIWTELR